jgi:hypothetical protein
MAVEVAVRVLINVVNCVETRDIQQAQRHRERRLTLDRAERERWGPDC